MDLRGFSFSIAYSLFWSGFLASPVWTLQTVSSSADSGPNTLRAALLNLNPAGDTIEFTGPLSITLTSGSLPPINMSTPSTPLTINGGASNITIDGNSLYQVFFAQQGTVTFQNFTNLTIQNAEAIGGAGGMGGGFPSSSPARLASGGGGGLGAGGAVFVNQSANVVFDETVTQLILDGNQAMGGAGGTGGNFGSGTPYVYAVCPGGGGGGGMLAPGGTGGAPSDSGLNSYGGGGGGGGGGGNSIGSDGGNGVSGSPNTGGAGGTGGGPSGGTGGASPICTTNCNTNGVNGVDGAAAPVAPAAFSGGGGGSGVAGDNSAVGGAGGRGNEFAGGGGGGGSATGATSNGGPGGFGGGGGAAGTSQGSQGSVSLGTGGTGGFGGGGGGCCGGDNSTSVFGGGVGNTFLVLGGGGGGAGLGGAIFVREGGSITIANGLSLSNNVANGGAGGLGIHPNTSGSPGIGAGDDFFLSSGATLIFNNTVPVTVSSTISSNNKKGGAGAQNGGGIVINSGTLTLSGINNLTRASGGTPIGYTGTTTINGGILAISNDNNLGIISGSGATASGNVAIGNGTWQFLGSVTSSRLVSLTGTSTVDTQNNAGQLRGIISGTGSLTKTGSGSLQLTAANTYQGGTIIADGSLIVGSDGILGATGTSLTIGGSSTSGATLQVTSSFDLNRSVILGVNGVGILNTINTNGQQLTIDGQVTGAGSLTVSDGTSTPGTLILNNSSNNFTSSMTINGPTVQMGAFPALASTLAVSVLSGTFDLHGFSQTIGNLSGAAGGFVTFGSTSGTQLTVNQTSPLIFAGVISGTGSLVLEGGSTLTLSGANTYTGNTTVSNGILAAGAADTFSPNSAVSMANAAGAVLNLNGHNQKIVGLSGGGGTGGNITLDGATLTIAGGGSFAGAISDNGSPGNMILDAPASTTTLTLSGTNTYSGTTQIDSGTLTLGVNNALSSSTSVVLANSANATLTLGSPGTPTISQTITNLTGGTGASVSFNGTASSASNLTLSDASGTFSGQFKSLSTSTSTLTINSSSTYTLNGSNTSALLDVNLNSGELIAGIAGAFPPGNYTLTGTPTLNLNGFSTTVRALNGSGTVDLSSNTSGGLLFTNGNCTYSGVIQDGGAAAGSIFVQGFDLYLKGANTYTGGTTVGFASLDIDNIGNLGSPNSGVYILTLNNSGSTLRPHNFIDFTSAASARGILAQGGGPSIIDTTNASMQISCLLTGDTTLIVTGSNTLTIAHSTSYGRGTTISSGATLALTGSGSLPSTGGVTTVSGTFDISALASGSSTTISPLTGSGIVQLGGNTLFVNSTSNSQFDGKLTGTGGSLTQIGGGTLTLSGTTTDYSGTTTVTLGTLTAGMAGAFSPNSAVSMANAGATLNLNGHNQSIPALSGGGSSGGNVLLNGATLTLTGTTIMPTTYGAYNGSIQGSGSLVLNAGSGTPTFQLSGSNTFTGPTTIDVGTLALSGSGLIATSSGVTVASAAFFDITAASSAVSINPLSGAGTVNLGGKALTVTSALTTSSTFSGLLEGLGGSLTKAGSNYTLTLTGSGNDYTGSTTVSGGFLSVTGPGKLSTSSAVILSGGELDLNGTSQSIPTLSGSSASSILNLGPLASTGTLTLTGASSNSSPYAGSITGYGNLTLAGTGVFRLTGTSNDYHGTTTIGAGATLRAGATNAFSQNSPVVVNSMGTLDLNRNSVAIPTLSGGGAVTFSTGILANTLTINGSPTAMSPFSGAITGRGNLNVNLSGGTFQLSGTGNTYSGTTAVNAGILQAGAAGAFSSASAVSMANIAGATLDLNGYSQTIASLSGGGTTGGNILLSSSSAGGTLTIDGGGSYAGVISDDGVHLGSVVLNGSNTAILTLSGANTYQGGTTIEGGTLRISAPGNLGVQNMTTYLLTFNGGSNSTILQPLGFMTIPSSGSLGILISSGFATIDTSMDLITIDLPITGSGGLILQGGDTLELSAANTYTGSTSINAGTLALIEASGSIADSSSVTVAGGAHFDISGLTPSGSASTSINLLSGAGAVALGGNRLTVVNTGMDTTFSGVIGGAGGKFVKSGTDILTLSGANTYTGLTTVSQGRLALSGLSGSVSASSGVSVAAGAFFDISNLAAASGTPGTTIGPLSGAGTVTLGMNALTVNSASLSTFSGALTGTTGSFTKTGAATLTLSGNGSNYTGNTTVSAGTLQTGAANALSSGSAVSMANVAGAILDLNGFSQTIAGLSGGGTTGGYVELSTASSTTSATLTLTGGGTYGGVISDDIGHPGGVTLNGSGSTLILSNSNTYHGTTTVTLGTLEAGAANAFSPNSSVSMGIAAGATFDLHGFNQTIKGLSGGGAAGGNVTLSTASSAGILTIVTNGNSYAGIISDNGKAGSVILSGTSSQTLTGNSTYSGGTTINANATLSLSGLGSVLSSGLVQADGTFDISNVTAGHSTNIGSLRGSGVVNLGANQLIVNSTGNTTFSGQLTGMNGSFTKAGSGFTLTLTNTMNTYTGATLVSAGILQAGAANAFPSSSPFTVDSGATLDLNGYNQSIQQLSGTGTVTLSSSSASGTLTVSGGGSFSGVISDNVNFPGSVVVSGSSLTLSGGNTYTGGTTIDANATLLLSGSGSLSSNGPVDVLGMGTFNIAGLTPSGSQTEIGLLSGAGAVVLGSNTLKVNSNSSSPVSSTFSGAITGNGGLTKLGGQYTLTLDSTGQNAYMGATTVTQGTLAAGNTNALSGSSAVVMNGGVLALDGFSQSIPTLSGGSGTVNLGAMGSTGTLTLTGVSSASSPYAGAITGYGNLMLSGSGVFRLTGILNDYHGTTTVSSGSLRAGAPNAFSQNSPIDLTGGTLDLNGFSVIIPGLSGSGPVTFSTLLNPNTLTIQNPASTPLIYSGAMSGRGNLTLNLGSGNVFQLSGTANQYRGTTTVSSGTLQAGVNGAFSPNSAVSVTTGATLDLNGYTETIPSLAGGGAVTLSSSSSGGTLIISGGGTFAGAITDTVLHPGGVTVNGGTLALSGSNTYHGTTTVNSGILQANAPGTFSPNSAVQMNGGTLALHSNSQSIPTLSGTSGTVNLSNSPATLTLTGGSSVFGGKITGLGNLAVSLTMGSIFQLSGSSNDYSGTTTIGANSTLQAGIAGAFSSSSAVTVGAMGTLDLNSLTNTIDSLSGSGSVLLGMNTNSNLIIDGSTSTTFSGVISGSGGVTRLGTGTTTLSASSTYLGTTTITTGTLQAGINNAFPTQTAVSIGNGTFDLNGFTQIIKSVNGAGAVYLSSSGTGGALTISNGGTYSGVISNRGISTAGAGSLALSGAILTLSGGNTYSGGTTIDLGATLALSGTGSLYFSGPMADNGIFDLTNLQTGGTEIGPLSGFGDVTLGSNTLTVNSTTSSTFGGAISGSGGLTKLGANTFTLSGTNQNSYSGTTTVSQGTLAALTGFDDVFSPNSPVSISTGATLQLNDTAQNIQSLSGGGSAVLGSGTLTLVGAASAVSTSYGGAITGSGGNLVLDLMNGGTLRLTSANNTYSGMTTVTAGTLQAGVKNAFSPSSAVSMGTASNALLDLNNFDVTIGSISGGGPGGNVTFNSSAIFRRTLTIGGAASMNPYNGAITGRGNVLLSGSGTLQVGGANTYSGTTTINSGNTLQSVANNAFSPNSDIVINGGVLDQGGYSNQILSLSGNGSVLLGSGLLTISGGKNTTYSGAISQNGSLTLLGGGTLTLTGANTYTGDTTVNGSTLVVGVNSVGSLASPVTVETGGMLKGTGTISELVTVEDGGTISGGNSIGTLTLGALTLESGANLTLEINNSGASTIYDVTTNAALAGNLAVTVDRGVYAEGTAYTFITTGVNGRTGVFDTITSNTYGTTALVGVLNYDTNFVELLITAPIYAIIPLNGLQGNSQALANYLNEFASNPALQPILLTVGGLPLSEMEAALDSISPERNAISSWTAQNSLLGIMSFASNRMQQGYLKAVESQPLAFNSAAEIEDQLLAAAGKWKPYRKAQTAVREKSNYAVWAEGIGQFAHQNAIDENPAFRSSTGAGLIGTDYYGFKNGQLGGAVGYAQTGITQSGAGKGTIQTYLAGLYGTAYLNDAYVELGLWGAFDQFYNTRYVVYPGFSAVATSRHNGWQVVPHAGVGYDVNFCWGTLEPFASFDAAALVQEGYSEHGAGVLDMKVASSTSWLLESEVGLNLYQVKTCNPGYLIFRETLSYVNLAPFATGTLSGTALVGFPPGFTVSSFTEVQNMISPGFEIFFKCKNNGFFISLIYDGEFTIGKGRYMLNEGVLKFGGFF